MCGKWISSEPSKYNPHVERHIRKDPDNAYQCCVIKLLSSTKVLPKTVERSITAAKDTRGLSVVIGEIVVRKRNKEREVMVNIVQFLLHCYLQMVNLILENSGEFGMMWLTINDYGSCL